MLPAYDRLLASMQRDATALQDNSPASRVDDITREFASLHAVLDGQCARIGERLALLATHSRNFGSAHGHVLAVRRADGSYDVRESEIMSEIADSHLALSMSLRAAATVFGTHLGEVETAAMLCALAEHHQKDASVLRALLWEEKPS